MVRIHFSFRENDPGSFAEKRKGVRFIDGKRGRVHFRGRAIKLALKTSDPNITNKKKGTIWPRISNKSLSSLFWRSYPHAPR